MKCPILYAHDVNKMPPKTEQVNYYFRKSYVD